MRGALAHTEGRTCGGCWRRVQPTVARACRAAGGGRVPGELGVWRDELCAKPAAMRDALRHSGGGPRGRAAAPAYPQRAADLRVPVGPHARGAAAGELRAAARRPNGPLGGPRARLAARSRPGDTVRHSDLARGHDAGGPRRSGARRRASASAGAAECSGAPLLPPALRCMLQTC
jgi:hypothetical protein